MPTRLQIDLGRHALARGGVIAYPTEAVWGLGCEPLNRHAVARLLALKRRSQLKGLILVASSFSQVEPYAAKVDRAALEHAFDTWPGPTTWLFPAARGVPGWLRGEHDTIALRVTAHPVARALCDARGGAIVSTSANLAGRPPACSALQVRCRFGGALDFIVPGDTGGFGRPTPIRDLLTGRRLRA